MIDLKTLLGEELSEKVKAALAGKGEGGKDLVLGVANDGSMIPKAKFDELNDKYKAAENLAADTKKQLDGLKAAGDPAELAKELEAARKAAKEQTDAHEKAMAALELDYAVRAAIPDAQDAALVASLVDKTGLKLKDGAVEGLDEQLKSLRETKPFLFKKAEPETGGFSSPRPGDSGGAGGCARRGGGQRHPRGAGERGRGAPGLHGGGRGPGGGLPGGPLLRVWRRGAMESYDDGSVLWIFYNGSPRRGPGSSA